MVKLDTKILLLLRDKLELVYDLEKFLDKIEQIDFSSHIIEQIKKDYYEGKVEVEYKVEVEATQDIIFNQFIQKLHILLEYFQKIENSTININEILSEVNIDLVLTYQCVDKNLNINFDNYTWF